FAQEAVARTRKMTERRCVDGKMPHSNRAYCAHIGSLAHSIAMFSNILTTVRGSDMPCGQEPNDDVGAALGEGTSRVELPSLWRSKRIPSRRGPRGSARPHVGSPIERVPSGLPGSSTRTRCRER